jgi:hypothetical protein
VTKLCHICAIFVVALPALASIPLSAKTAGRSQPGDPTARSGTQATGEPSQRQSESQPNQPQSPSPAPQEQDNRQGSTLQELGTIRGAVTDINDDPVAGATVDLQGPEPGDVRTVTTNDQGVFEIHDVEPGIPYHVTVSARGFATGESPVVILKPGQLETLNVSKLPIEEVQTSVTVTPESSEEIAIQEVKIEEKQRGFAVIPNFFEAYGPNPAPLTAKLKFNLTLRVAIDPFTLVGIAVIAAAEQGAGTPNYVQGARGFAERFGANYANQFTDIMIGGAILPSILHQDPRYFYQGTGTKKSRALHAISDLIITKGDNGRRQPNYSSLGGDLASAAISNAYYPRANRGAGLVFQNFAIDTAVHIGVRMFQEFVFRPTKGTTAPNAGNPSVQ